MTNIKDDIRGNQFGILSYMVRITLSVIKEVLKMQAGRKVSLLSIFRISFLQEVSSVFITIRSLLVSMAANTCGQWVKS